MRPRPANPALKNPFNAPDTTLSGDPKQTLWLHQLLKDELCHTPSSTRKGCTTPFPSATATPPASRPAQAWCSLPYGSNADGALVSPDFAGQVQQAFHNLRVALAAHGLDLPHVVQLRTYVVNLDFNKLGIIGRAVQAGCGDLPPTQTVIGVAALAMPDILFEVEAVAVQS